MIFLAGISNVKRPLIGVGVIVSVPIHILFSCCNLYFLPWVNPVDIFYLTLLFTTSRRHVSSFSIPVHGKVYSLQHYGIKFVSDLRQNGGFLQVIWFPPPIKLTTTIYLKYC
jgi:hypothetical protein